jgi:hypothetical protein
MQNLPEQTMTAESRHETRDPPRLTVQVLYGRRRFCSAQVRDVSIEGMSLTLRNLSLPAGTLVGLELGGLGAEWLVEAVVVRSAGTEVSVRFREPQPELFQRLVQAGIKGKLGGESTAIAPPPLRVERPQLARY